MASVLSRVGFTQICVACGTVARTGVGDAEGELQLWYSEGSNEEVHVALWYVKLLMFLLRFTSKSALTKSKRY